MSAMLLHIPSAADALGLPVYAVRRLIESGALPYRRIDGRTYIPESAVDAAAQIVAAALRTANVPA
jgi:excisionase family DNA binding protein